MNIREQIVQILDDNYDSDSEVFNRSRAADQIQALISSIESSARADEREKVLDDVDQIIERLQDENDEEITREINKLHESV